MRRAAPQNKQLRPAYEDKAAPVAVAPRPGVPYAGHGRVVCSCGTVLAACAHAGHQAIFAVLPRRCGECR